MLLNQDDYRQLLEGLTEIVGSDSGRDKLCQDLHIVFNNNSSSVAEFAKQLIHWAEDNDRILELLNVALTLTPNTNFSQLARRIAPTPDQDKSKPKHKFEVPDFRGAEEFGVLRLGLAGDWTVDDLARFCSSLQAGYDILLPYVLSVQFGFEITRAARFYHLTRELKDHRIANQSNRRLFNDPDDYLSVDTSSDHQMGYYENQFKWDPGLAPSLEILKRPLTVRYLHIASPGWIEVVGAWNPLKVVGDVYLKVNEQKEAIAKNNQEFEIKMKKIESDAVLEKQRMEAIASLKRQKLETEAALERQKLETEAALKRLELEQQILQSEHALQIEKQKLFIEQQDTVIKRLLQLTSTGHLSDMEGIAQQVAIKLVQSLHSGRPEVHISDVILTSLNSPRPEL